MGDAFGRFMSTAEKNIVMAFDPPTCCCCLSGGKDVKEMLQSAVGTIDKLVDVDTVYRKLEVLKEACVKIDISTDPLGKMVNDMKGYLSPVKDMLAKSSTLRETAGGDDAPPATEE